MFPCVLCAPCGRSMSTRLSHRQPSNRHPRYASWTRISPWPSTASPSAYIDAEERFEGFENLMPFKVHNILLVSSLYDSFILREDGRLNELLIDQSLDLNLQQIPGITHVSSVCAKRRRWPALSNST